MISFVYGVCVGIILVRVVDVVAKRLAKKFWAAYGNDDD